MELYDKLAIPKACRVNRTVYKKLFYDNAELTAKDKALFADSIDKITWVACLKAETVNIPIFRNAERDYPEMEVIEVTLSADKGLRRIAEIIMHTIPYPMLLVFRMNDAYQLPDGRFQLWAAHQHLSLADSGRVTLESFEHTGWLTADSDLPDALNLKTMRWNNFFVLYSDMVDAISIWRARQLTQDNQTTLTGDEARLLLAAAEELNAQIAKLKAELKKEKQFNRKMEIGIKIKQLEENYQKLIEAQNEE